VVEQIEVDGMMRSTLVFRVKPRRVYLGLGLNALFVAGGVVALLTSPPSDSGARFWAGALIVMFGVFLVLGIAQLRHKGYLALLREGIYSKSTISRTLVRWETIERLGVAPTGFQRWLGLRVSRPPEVDSGWSRALARTNRPLSGWDVTYPLPLIAGGDALPELIERYARDADARRELG
jgi:hypothetical protein